MKRASITEAKNNLSSLIDSLQGGEPVLIMDRDRPVAWLAPVSERLTDAIGRLARLGREGSARPARTAPAHTLFTDEPPQLAKGASALAALLAERREGR